MRGLNAEGDDSSLGGDSGGEPTGRAEFVGLADHVVGGEHQHESIVVAFCRQHG